MPKGIIKPRARKQSTMVRRVIVTKSGPNKESPRFDNVRHEVRCAFDALKDTALRLERVGIAVPPFKPDMHSQTVAKSTPKVAIQALKNAMALVSEARITIHIDPFLDDTTEAELTQSGISHLVGVQALKAGPNSWNCVDLNGLLAIVSVKQGDLKWLVHDVLLDMVMLRSASQPWSALRATTTSREIAAHKAVFAHAKSLTSKFAYGTPSANVYVPLSGFVRDQLPGGHVSPNLNLEQYVNLWHSFSDYCATRTPPIPVDTGGQTSNLMNEIVRNHRHGGQISPTKLRTAIAGLALGVYRLYFGIHRAADRQVLLRMSSFFQKSPSKNRTQQWIIYPISAYETEATYLVERGYVVYYTFEVRGLNEIK